MTIEKCQRRNAQKRQAELTEKQTERFQFLPTFVFYQSVSTVANDTKCSQNVKQKYFTKNVKFL